MDSPTGCNNNMVVDLSVTPFRRWKKSHFSHNRRYSSGPLPLFSQHKSLGEFVRPRKLDLVLRVFPEDMPLLTFCQMDPNNINIEEEALREKVIVALHAARASCYVNTSVDQVSSFLRRHIV